jgi:Domain of unknown function (DUF3883)
MVAALADGDKFGTDWEADEIGPVVTAYFEMLDSDLLGIQVNKAAKYRELSALTGRTHKSVERKFQNISAVLDKLEEPWIRGLAPLFNVQKALSEAIDNYLSNLGRQPILLTARAAELAEERSTFISHPITAHGFLDYVPVPSLVAPLERLPDHVERLVRKFDPVMRDFRAREIGAAGEKMVFEHERASLHQNGFPELARKVSWVSKELGDGAGYDVMSYDSDGREKFIEVKTTVGSSTTPFLMTRNEKDFADEADDRYRIARIFDFRRQPRAFELTSPLDSFVRFEPESYRASFS